MHIQEKIHHAKMQTLYTFGKEFYHIKGSPFDTFKKTSHYICHFAIGSLRINCISLYQYKGSSNRILVGCFANVPSLNSHENGVLAGCFFKNSKYVYKLTSHLVAIENVKIKRGKQKFFSYNSRREHPTIRLIMNFLHL